MKSASATTLEILSSGNAVIAELYDFELPNGQAYHFTSFATPLTCSIYSPAAGPFTYKTGLTIKRDTLTQKAGTEAGNMKLIVSPQPDSPNAPVLINGYPFLTACRLGFFDNANVQMSRLFMWPPALSPTGFLDPSPGAVGFFKGQVEDLQVGRVSAQMTVDDYLALLGAQNMPRQLFGVGCYHQVYDAGCGLLKAQFTVSGTVTAVTDGAHFTTNLGQAAGYFDLGVITFTSGVNDGFAANVSSFAAGGALITSYPFPKAPAVGDTFTIYPGCDLQQSTCTSKFNNLLHFGGQPYIPDPSTIVDGDTQAPPEQPQGSQAGLIIGSSPAASATYGSYKT